MTALNILKKASTILTGATLFFLGTTASVKAINIVPSSDGQTLVNNIAGKGINIVPGSVSYTGAGCASGTFTDGFISGIGIDSGIILTTGCAKSAVGPNTSDGTTTSHWISGDSDLNGLIPGPSTNDATILEFDIESKGGDLFFNYVFASEEYNEYVDSSFNDVFGFFVDGVNIPLIPGTNQPVSVNSINGNSNPWFFNNNDLSDGGPFYDIEYDGFTNLFTAKLFGLSAGTHTLKFAIADAGDSALDSAVFIQEDSLVSTPEPASILSLLVAGALGASSLKRKRKEDK